MPSSDNLFQNFSTVQSKLQPKPVTLASAASISPVGRLTILTGTTDVATVVPPIEGHHELILVFTNANPGDLLTTGNLILGLTTVLTNCPVALQYDPNQAKYYIGPYSQ